MAPVPLVDEQPNNKFVENKGINPPRGRVDPGLRHFNPLKLKTFVSMRDNTNMKIIYKVCSCFSQPCHFATCPRWACISSPHQPQIISHLKVQQ